MATLDVLDAVRDVADQVTGIVSAYRLWPEKPIPDNRLPAAVVSLERERQGFIELAGLERWEWPVRIDILVKRDGDIQTEQGLVIPLLEGFIEKTRGNANLSGDGAFHANVFWDIRQVSAYQNIYLAAVIQTTVEQHFEVSSQIQN